MERTLESTVLHIARTRLVKDYPGQIAACLDALNDNQIWWRPNEQANSVANLLLHLAGSNRYYFGHVINGEPDARDRDAEFAARGGHSKTEVRRVWDEAVALADQLLGGLQPSRLMETTDRTGKTTTYAQVVLHVTHHNAVHVGQIVYIAKQLSPGALDDIWMKMRGR
jgi:uncharacterized damage-inducible protein DinB